ncbi:IS66 family transposase [Paraburkholderia fungorum]|uniref:IS66 family transposase n=1 Tax=Paraburkholderia fungorum TaxID=134537 RepID=UPI001C1EDAA5|nr:transposase [Paraburkholderia fungorum]
MAKDQKEPGLAAQALQWIAKLYAIESRVKDQAPDIKLVARQTEALPVLAQFLQWLETDTSQMVTTLPGCWRRRSALSKSPPSQQSKPEGLRS